MSETAVGMDMYVHMSEMTVGMDMHTLCMHTLCRQKQPSNVNVHTGSAHEERAQGDRTDG